MLVFSTLVQLLKIPLHPKRKLFFKIRSITGFLPGDLHLYEVALIHKSASVKIPDGSTLNNERLEYLGDAVLDAIIAEHLYNTFPDQNEGFLTQLRSKIVKRKQLNKLAFKIGLAPLIKSNTGLSQSKFNISGNALEALIGAIYMDKGYNRTRKFVIEKILSLHLDLDKLARKESDFKSRIIEWAQKNKKEISFFSQESINENHETFFTSCLMLLDEELGSGTGYSKKDAEQMAAEEALSKLIQ